MTDHIRKTHSRRLSRMMLTLLVGTLITQPLAAQVPKEDPAQGDGRVSAFYRWTEALPDQPGQMLRTEPLPTELGLSGAATQLRILYTSTDGVSDKGQLPTSGAIFIPRGVPPKGGWPVIAWAHGTVGMADVCAPSWAQRSYRDVRYLNSWLAEGYAIVATDYQGLGTAGPHPYLQVRPEAYGVLDAVRAALATKSLNLANKVVVVGQSQGGGAAVATALFAKAYAPDVKLLGTVATGVPYTNAPQAPRDPNAVDSGIAISFYLMLMAQQQNPSLNLDTIYTPLARPVFEQARTSCAYALEHDVVLEELTIAKSVKPGMTQALAPLYRSLIYPSVKFDAPLFIGAGEKDEMTPVEAQNALARDACKAGSVVALHRYPGLSHEAAVNVSLKDSLPFVRKLFAAQPVQSTCGQ